MDAMRHVNNVVYYNYIAEARVDWYEHLGDAREGMDAVVVYTHCSYMVPLVYPGTVEVRTYAGSPGRSSFEMIHEIRRADQPDVLCARGGTRAVWVNPGTGKSVPIPVAIRQLIAG
jgi:acyl-CoA thioester hydrolase